MHSQIIEKRAMQKVGSVCTRYKLRAASASNGLTKSGSIDSESSAEKTKEERGRAS